MSLLASVDGAIRDLCPDRVDELVRKINECDVMIVSGDHGAVYERVFYYNLPVQCTLEGPQFYSKRFDNIIADFGKIHKYTRFKADISRSGYTGYDARLVIKDEDGTEIVSASTYDSAVDIAPMTGIHVLNVSVDIGSKNIDSKRSATISGVTIEFSSEKRYSIEL